jgi:hypothetical protein
MSFWSAVGDIALVVAKNILLEVCNRMGESSSVEKLNNIVD